MKAFVIGSGGREHAIAWKLSRSSHYKELYAAPGNPGIAQVATCLSVPDGSPEAFLAAAESAGADLTVVGPEMPLVAGIVDAFRAAGRRIIGPSAEAARLEGSKVHAKMFFRRLGIPTADFVTADTPADARNAVDRFGYPVVLKADGL